MPKSHESIFLGESTFLGINLLMNLKNPNFLVFCSLSGRINLLQRRDLGGLYQYVLDIDYTFKIDPEKSRTIGTAVPVTTHNDQGYKPCSKSDRWWPLGVFIIYSAINRYKSPINQRIIPQEVNMVGVVNTLKVWHVWVRVKMHWQINLSR